MRDALSWLSFELFNNSVSDYLRAVVYLLSFILAFLVLKRAGVERLRRFAQTTATDFDDFLADVLAHIRPVSFVVLSLFIATRSLALETPIHAALRFTVVTVLTFQMVMILQKVVYYGISKTLFRKSDRNDPTAQAAIKSFSTVLNTALWGIGLVFILDNLGLNISAIVAGLGITGVAMAMAAQTVLADLFSALALYADRPFKVGDRLVIDAFEGTVESIGLKTTRIRSVTGETIIFANADIAKARIRNYRRSRAATEYPVKHEA